MSQVLSVDATLDGPGLLLLLLKARDEPSKSFNKEESQPWQEAGSPNESLQTQATKTSRMLSYFSGMLRTFLNLQEVKTPFGMLRLSSECEKNPEC